MKDRVFLDTNILIYAASSLGFPEKYSRAEQIMAEEDFGISPQVVGEFIRNVQNPKKMMTPLTGGEVDRWIDYLCEFPVLSIDRELIMSATVFQRRYQIGFWDGPIPAATHRFGAALLFSEDLGHGQAYGSLRCENPFRNV
jgi:predicted nucleic acid-binding protein